MTNKEALSEANESSGECDWGPRRSKSQAEGCGEERAVADGQAGSSCNKADEH
jgi:hypothetical protein